MVDWIGLTELADELAGYLRAIGASACWVAGILERWSERTVAEVGGENWERHQDGDSSG